MDDTRRLQAAEAEIRRLRDELRTIIHLCEHQVGSALYIIPDVAERAVRSSASLYPMEDE
jgi:hypothetical protein